jgi:hypothetical protein
MTETQHPFDGHAMEKTVPALMRSSGQFTQRQVVPFLIGLAIVMAIFLAITLLWAIPRGFIFDFDFQSMYTGGYLERTNPSELFSLAAQREVQRHATFATGEPLPFIHPAYEALLFVPFSMLSYTGAYTAFLLFNGLLTAACVLAGWELFSEKISIIQPSTGLMLFFFFPLYIAILQGQDSILFLLMVLLAWREMEQARLRTAGIILAIALIKPQIILPLTVLLTIRYGRRLAEGFTAGTAGVVLLNYISSPGGAERFLQLIRNSAGRHAGGAWYVRPLVMANLRGVAFAVFEKHLSEQEQLWIVGAASAVLLTVVAFCMRRVRSEQLTFAVALLTCLLISYHLYPHDLTILAIPILAIAKEMHAWKKVLIVLLYVSPLAFFLIGSQVFYLTAVSLMIALVALLAGAERKLLAIPAGAA